MRDRNEITEQVVLWESKLALIKRWIFGVVLPWMASDVTRQIFLPGKWRCCFWSI
jgi:hypothetical protein